MFSKAADAVKGAGHRAVEGVKYATGLKGEEGEGELGSTGWGFDNRGRKGRKGGQVTGCRELVMVGRMALRFTSGGLGMVFSKPVSLLPRVCTGLWMRGAKLLWAKWL